MDPRNKASRLPQAVVVLGFVSLFTDISSEMVASLLPVFLLERVAHAPVVLGAMEGLAELVAAGFKWWSGKWADRASKLRPMVVAGYAIASIARPFMALVTTWWQPLLIRSVDRVGKGLRSAPRDAMIAHWAHKNGQSAAFGFHRGMDHTGAALGAVLAATLVAMGFSIDRVFLFSAIPASLAVLAIFAVREPPRPSPPKDDRPMAPMPRRLGFYLVPVGLFSLANLSDAFLLLRLSEQGLASSFLPLAWLGLNGVKAVVSYPAGRLADRLGPEKLVPVGWALYALSYLGFAFSTSAWVTSAVMLFYGLYHGLTEGAEKGLLAELAPVESRGRAFGSFHAMAGFGSLIGGTGLGFVWDSFGARWAFLGAALIAALGAVSLPLLLPKARQSGSPRNR